jgi:hypothetical protein
LSHALASRREYVSAEVSALCSTTEDARLLCIGSAALRDLESLFPLFARTAADVVVVESKQDRLTGISDSLFTAVPSDSAPVNRDDWGLFHMIYAPNLLNELKETTAKRAVAALASVLKRGGRLLLTNFSPDLADWHYRAGQAHLRSEEEVSLLSQHIPDEQFMGQVVWRDTSGLLVFLEISR